MNGAYDCCGGELEVDRTAPEGFMGVSSWAESLGRYEESGYAASGMD